MKESKSWHRRAQAGIFFIVFNQSLFLHAQDYEEETAPPRRCSYAVESINKALMSLVNVLPVASEKVALCLSGIKNAGVYCVAFLYEQPELAEDDNPDHLLEPSFPEYFAEVKKNPQQVDDAPIVAKDPGETSLPTVSKRRQKFEDRWAKARKNLDETSRKNLPIEPEQKTYADVKLMTRRDMKDEIKRQESKIKILLLSLAHGEHRGRLERLRNVGPNSYSMRLTQKDRLAFQIIEGDLNNGVRTIRLLSAQGHYGHLEKMVKSSKTQKEEIYEWPVGDQLVENLK